MGLHATLPVPYPGGMTTITGDRATVLCARCNSKITFTDVIGTRRDWSGEYLNILFAPFTVNVNRTLCHDCEPMSDEDFLSLADTEPPRDLEFEMLSSWYWLDRP